jgi:hypothetical protein
MRFREEMETNEMTHKLTSSPSFIQYVHWRPIVGGTNPRENSSSSIFSFQRDLKFDALGSLRKLNQNAQFWRRIVYPIAPLDTQQKFLFHEYLDRYTYTLWLIYILTMNFGFFRFIVLWKVADSKTCSHLGILLFCLQIKIQKRLEPYDRDVENYKSKHCIYLPSSNQQTCEKASAPCNSAMRSWWACLTTHRAPMATMPCRKSCREFSSLNEFQVSFCSTKRDNAYLCILYMPLPSSVHGFYE